MIGFDPMYFVYMIPGLLFMLWAQSRVKGTYQKFSKVPNDQNLTGAQTARRVLDQAGLQNVAVEATKGELTDHYDPRNRTLYLSQGVYGVPSVAAMGIAAHEAGHAMQHAQAYAPLQLRSALVPAVNIGSNLGFIVVIAGLFLQNPNVAWAGVILFALSTVFALVTLPVEFDASNRAKQALAAGGMVNVSEGQGVAQVLNAAAWTYIASFAASVLTLLYYVSLVTGMRRSE